VELSVGDGGGDDFALPGAGLVAVLGDHGVYSDFLIRRLVRWLATSMSAMILRRAM
jgi:hypothetical protein